jgi:hypothetical protein
MFPARSGESIVGYSKAWAKIAKLGDLPSDITRPPDRSRVG